MPRNNFNHWDELVREAINHAAERMDYWVAISLDAQSAEHLGKTTKQALELASYFEGRFDQAIDCRGANSHSHRKLDKNEKKAIKQLIKYEHDKFVADLLSRLLKENK